MSGPSGRSGGLGGTRISSVRQNYCRSHAILWSICRSVPVLPPRLQSLAAQ